MRDENEVNRKTIEVIAIWLAVLVSFSNLGILIWKGGAMANSLTTSTHNLETLGAKVEQIEREGTAGLKGHTALNDANFNGLDKRVLNLENVVTRFSSIEADIREIKTRIQFMSPEKTKQ